MAKFGLLAFLVLLAPRIGVGYYITYDYAAKFESRLGLHLNRPRDLATHRQLLEFKSLFRYGPKISLQADYRGFVEGALASNDARYGNSEAVHRQSHEIVPRDLYLSFKSGPWDLRLGNQQVVWGEAFGFYFADIVNPKDLREAGIGDLEFNRIQTPLVNAKFIRRDYSAQLIYVPKPYFHRLPSPGSDYFTLSGFFPPAATLAVDDTRTLPIFSNGEVGGRVTANLDNLDLSVFGFSYFDRFPTYTATIAGSTVSLMPHFQRVFTTGVTGTYDLTEYLLRMELLFTKNRRFNTLVANQLSTEQSDELTAVIELDNTELKNWHLGAQLAHTFLTADFDPITGSRHTTQLTLYADGTVWKQQTLAASLSYEPTKGSTLTQLRYLIPLSDILELRLAGEYFSGGRVSPFGKYSQASRFYFQLRAYLNGVY